MNEVLEDSKGTGESFDSCVKQIIRSNNKPVRLDHITIDQVIEDLITNVTSPGNNINNNILK